MKMIEMKMFIFAFWNFLFNEKLLEQYSMSVCDNFILVIIFFLSDLINKCVYL